MIDSDELVRKISALELMLRDFDIRLECVEENGLYDEHWHERIDKLGEAREAAEALLEDGQNSVLERAVADAYRAEGTAWFSEAGYWSEAQEDGDGREIECALKAQELYEAALGFYSGILHRSTNVIKQDMSLVEEENKGDAAAYFRATTQWNMAAGLCELANIYYEMGDEGYAAKLEKKGRAAFLTLLKSGVLDEEERKTIAEFLSVTETAGDIRGSNVGEDIRKLSPTQVGDDSYLDLNAFPIDRSSPVNILSGPNVVLWKAE